MVANQKWKSRLCRKYFEKLEPKFRAKGDLTGTLRM
jgi:hypothetical protein